MLQDNSGIVFDMDGTLIYSNDKVGIPLYRNGIFIRNMSAGEFSTYEHQPDDKFDYSLANNPEHFLKNAIASPIFFTVFANLDRIIHEKNSNCELYILTARQPNMEDAIHKFFCGHGIKTLKRTNVIGVPSGFAPKLKKMVLEDLATHHDTVLFYDDDHKNVLYASEVDKVYPYKVKCQKL